MGPQQTVQSQSWTGSSDLRKPTTSHPCHSQPRPPDQQYPGFPLLKSGEADKRTKQAISDKSQAIHTRSTCPLHAAWLHQKQVLFDLLPRPSPALNPEIQPRLRGLHEIFRRPEAATDMSLFRRRLEIILDAIAALSRLLTEHHDDDPDLSRFRSSQSKKIFLLVLSSTYLAMVALRHWQTTTTSDAITVLNWTAIYIRLNNLRNQLDM
jgi:hypothetical protein